MSLNLGRGTTNGGTTTDTIIQFTLEGASDALKLGFAFLFGFFGELSVELLRNVMKQSTGT